jgi:hypothetical protein
MSFNETQSALVVFGVLTTGLMFAASAWAEGYTDLRGTYQFTYRKLVTQALRSSGAILRAYAANLHAYATRVRKAPVSSNAS